MSYFVVQVYLSRNHKKRWSSAGRHAPPSLARTSRPPLSCFARVPAGSSSTTRSLIRTNQDGSLSFRVRCSLPLASSLHPQPLRIDPPLPLHLVTHLPQPSRVPQLTSPQHFPLGDLVPHLPHPHFLSFPRPALVARSLPRWDHGATGIDARDGSPVRWQVLVGREGGDGVRKEGGGLGLCDL